MRFIWNLRVIIVQIVTPHMLVIIMLERKSRCFFSFFYLTAIGSGRGGKRYQIDKKKKEKENE